MINRRVAKRERVERNRARANVLESSFSDPSANKIFIDCSFSHVMDDFERNSLVVQLMQSYSHLRNFGSRTQMLVTSVDDSLDARIRKQGGDQWVVHRHKEPLEEVLREDLERVIVMSPDAAEELTPGDVAGECNIFVIGGIVDRCVSRNETCHKALRLGLRARRLPVDSDRFVNKVFNIDSVFQFLLRAMDAKPPSREALVSLLEEVLPSRKKKQSEKVTADTKKVKAINAVLRPDPSNALKLNRYSVLDLFRR